MIEQQRSIEPRLWVDPKRKHAEEAGVPSWKLNMIEKERNRCILYNISQQKKRVELKKYLDVEWHSAFDSRTVEEWEYEAAQRAEHISWIEEDVVDNR